MLEFSHISEDRAPARLQKISGGLLETRLLPLISLGRSAYLSPPVALLTDDAAAVSSPPN
jgi:hypothetical protein